MRLSVRQLLVTILVSAVIASTLATATSLSPAATGATSSTSRAAENALRHLRQAGLPDRLPTADRARFESALAVLFPSLFDAQAGALALHRPIVSLGEAEQRLAIADLSRLALLTQALGLRNGPVDALALRMLRGEPWTCDRCAFAVSTAAEADVAERQHGSAGLHKMSRAAVAGQPSLEGDEVQVASEGACQVAQEAFEAVCATVVASSDGATSTSDNAPRGGGSASAAVCAAASAALCPMLMQATSIDAAKTTCRDIFYSC